MKAKDIFGLVLRCVALWIGVWGAWQVLASAAVHFTTGGFSPTVYLLYGIPAFLAGALILLFADKLVDLTYRPPPE